MSPGPAAALFLLFLFQVRPPLSLFDHDCPGGLPVSFSLDSVLGFAGDGSRQLAGLVSCLSCWQTGTQLTVCGTRVCPNSDAVFVLFGSCFSGRVLQSPPSAPPPPLLFRWSKDALVFLPASWPARCRPVGPGLDLLLPCAEAVLHKQRKEPSPLDRARVTPPPAGLSSAAALGIRAARSQLQQPWTGTLVRFCTSGIKPAEAQRGGTPPSAPSHTSLPPPGTRLDVSGQVKACESPTMSLFRLAVAVTLTVSDAIWAFHPRSSSPRAASGSLAQATRPSLAPPRQKTPRLRPCARPTSSLPSRAHTIVCAPTGICTVSRTLWGIV